MSKVIYIKEGKKLSIKIKDIVKGRVIKGPLAGAIVFYDVNGNGILDAGEPFIRSDANGFFTLDANVANSSIYVSTDNATTDTITGKVVSGITMSAPAGASVVTPITTLIDQGGIGSEELAILFGVPGIDLLSYDQYADGADMATAIIIDSVSTIAQMYISALISSVISSGISGQKALEIVTVSIVDAIKEKGNFITADFNKMNTNAKNQVAAAGGDMEAYDTAANINTLAVLSEVDNIIAAASSAVSLNDFAVSASNSTEKIINGSKAVSDAVSSGQEPPSDVYGVSKTKLTDATIQQAVNDWIENPEQDQFTKTSHSPYYGPISKWDVSEVTNMSGLFKFKNTFNDDISLWDVSSVTDMSSMFCNAHQFNQPLNNWNVSKVTDMSYMFSNAKAFNKPLNDWDVSSVTDMSGMFLETAVFNQPLDKWDISNVLDMSYMFYGSAKNTQDISAWKGNYHQDVEKFAMCCLTDLSGCDLSGCDLSCCDLSHCDLSGCDLSNCDLSHCKCDD